MTNETTNEQEPEVHYRLVTDFDGTWSVYADSPGGATRTVIEDATEDLATFVARHLTSFRGDDVTIIPEVTIPTGAVERVQRVRQVIEESGLYDLLGEVYRDLWPARVKVRGSDVDLYDAFDQATGWSDLFSDLMSLAGACMTAVDAYDGDITLPAWIDPDHKLEVDVEHMRRFLGVGAHDDLARRCLSDDPEVSGPAFEEARRVYVEGNVEAPTT